ncbi:nucleotidyltransferase family protein [Oceanicaulis alexandrii]|uniref:nucleotidyltransferase family protein n=1 Tax=Oceanicaulis alexandrii TaxID=153233 RepID=UPI0035CF1E84
MTPTTAMVMAAGLGTRMRPLTNDRCKALVELDGKPLIDWTLDKLAMAGVETAVVNVHHFADRLEAHLAARTSPRILTSDEREQLLETGGGLAKAAPVLGETPIFVANIDSVWVEDDAESELRKLAAAFDPERMDALLLITPTENTLGFDGPGDFFMDKDGRLTRRSERASAPYAYTGVQILHPRVLKGLPVEPFSTNLIWNAALKARRVHGCVMDAFWMHVGDPEAREAAENRLRSLA